jgi:hypothetical protein
MYHANPAASAAPGAGLRCHSRILFEAKSGAWEALSEGQLYSSPPARQAFHRSYPLDRIAWTIAHGPRISSEALRKGIEERADRGNHAAPRWKHSMHNTGP